MPVKKVEPSYKQGLWYYTIIVSYSEFHWLYYDKRVGESLKKGKPAAYRLNYYPLPQSSYERVVK